MCSYFRITSYFSAQYLICIYTLSFYSVMDYPFYGVQFHPEKSNFEWMVDSVVSHSAESVLVSQYFANFFVSEGTSDICGIPTKQKCSPSQFSKFFFLAFFFLFPSTKEFAPFPKHNRGARGLNLQLESCLLQGHGFRSNLRVLRVLLLFDTY